MNFHFPEGFSMRAGVQLCRWELRAARVDKPRKEEAVWVWDRTMGKEYRRVTLTLPRVLDRPCLMSLPQSFFATLIAGTP